MLLLLDRDAHAQRLRDLLGRFRDHERRIKHELHLLQLEADHADRVTSQRQLAENGAPRVMLVWCSELQHEWEELANDLVDVRMAIAGACEELALHEREVPRFHLAHETPA